MSMEVVCGPAIGMPVVSVCVANYNGEHLLAECIDSILAQRGDYTIEIIVHDDASRDDSIPLLQVRYPQVKVIRSERNVGYCIANNRMAAAATGRYLLLLNNDATLFEDAISALLATARRQQPEGILTLPQHDRDSGQLVDRGCLLDPFCTPIPNLDPHKQDVAYVIGACLWVPRTLWEELNGFPEWMDSIAEDIFLCCAARLLGYPVQAIAASGYGHRQGASFGGNRVDRGRLDTTYRRRRLSERNRLAVLVVCTPTWLVWPWLALHTMALVSEGLLLSLLKATLDVWRGIYWPALNEVYGKRRILLRQRRMLQAKRVIGLGIYLQGFSAIPRKLLLLSRYGLPRIRA